MGLLDVFDLSQLYGRLIKFLGPVGRLIDQGVQAGNHLTTIIQRMTKLLDDAVAEFKAWKNFREDIHLKSRVVNVESAFLKTKNLIEGIPAAWHSIVDIVREFRRGIPTETANVEIAELSEETVGIEEGTGEIIAKLFARFPRLLKGLARASVVLGLILQSLESTSKVIDDLQSILAEITGLRLEIERLDTVFLSQGNKRKRLRLENGKTINIRLGKLHPAV